MGGELRAAPARRRRRASRAPRCAIPARATSRARRSQRVQIVKGWVEPTASARARLRRRGRRANGASVDPRTCQPRGAGADALCAVWRDPEFDPRERAFYYARVLENPTCRWSQRVCNASGVDCAKPETIGEGLEACCAPEHRADDPGARVDVADLGEPRVKRPLLRFVLLGTALFALDRTVGERVDSEPPFPRGAVVSDDELLLHEAIARGFHESDTVVRRRLAMNLAFAEGERGRGEDALVREALAMGMHESDLVVQRRLVQKMRLALADTARAMEPSDAELGAYLARHRARFIEPARVRAVQLYFATRARAEAVSAQLPEAPEAALTLGEPLPFGAQLAALSQDELARQLGAAFAGAVFALEPGAWSPPVESSYGFHRVFVQERTPARETPLAIVRGEVREALLAERGDAAVRLALAAQRARYELSERRAR